MPWSVPHPLPAEIRTSRFLIRPYTVSDAQDMLDAINESRSSLLPWLPWARIDNRSIAECIYNIERFRRLLDDPSSNEFPVGVFDPATGRLAGGTGLIRINRETHQGEIGYWVRAGKRRQGVAAETTAVLISSALTPQHRGGWGLRRVVIYCVAENLASRGVPQKLGLRLELAAKGDRWLPGTGFVDTLGWGVNAGEWDTENHRIVSTAEVVRGSLG